MGISSRCSGRNLYNYLNQKKVSNVLQYTFNKEGIIFQIGVAPRRIDIITHIDGVDFNKAFEDKFEIELEGLKLFFISKENLIKNKESTGRKKDLLDAEYLRSK